jgi:hypothetical protein
LVLGYNWLHRFNPLINWSDATITFRTNTSGLSLSTPPAIMPVPVSVALATDEVPLVSVYPADTPIPMATTLLAPSPSMDTSGPSMDTPEASAPQPLTTAPPVSLVSAVAYRAIIRDKDTVQYTLRATPSKEATARTALTGQPDTTGLPLEYHDFADVFSEQEAYNLPLIESSILRSKLRMANSLQLDMSIPFPKLS